MSDEKKKNPTPKFLQSLINAICESAEADTKSLKEALAEEGFDHDKLVENGLSFIHDLERKQRFAIAKKKRSRLLEIIDSINTKTYKGTKDELLAKLKEIFWTDAPSAAVQAYFHKIESFDKEDLSEMLNEIEILKLFEQEISKDEN